MRQSILVNFYVKLTVIQVMSRFPTYQFYPQNMSCSSERSQVKSSGTFSQSLEVILRFQVNLRTIHV